MRQAAGIRCVVHWAVGGGGQRVVYSVAGGESGLWCLGLWAACVGHAVCQVTGSGLLWSGSRHLRKDSHGRLCNSTRGDLVIVVQRKLQSSALKLMNCVLWGRNSLKKSPRALVPLASDMGTVNHTFSSCPEAAVSSHPAGLRLNAPRLGSLSTAVLESSSATRATVGASR